MVAPTATSTPTVAPTAAPTADSTAEQPHTVQGSLRGYQQQGEGGAADDDRDCNRLVMILGGALVVLVAFATVLAIKLCVRQQPSDGDAEAKTAAPSIGQEPIKHGRRTEVELAGACGAGWRCAESSSRVDLRNGPLVTSTTE